MSCGKARASVEKKKALRPNAASGNAVAVPRWSGKLSAAALIEPLNAEQLPAPVKKENKHSDPMLYPPGPASKAVGSLVVLHARREMISHLLQSGNSLQRRKLSPGLHPTSDLLHRRAYQKVYPWRTCLGCQKSPNRQSDHNMPCRGRRRTTRLVWVEDSLSFCANCGAHAE